MLLKFSILLKKLRMEQYFCWLHRIVLEALDTPENRAYNGLAIKKQGPAAESTRRLAPEKR